MEEPGEMTEDEMEAEEFVNNNEEGGGKANQPDIRVKEMYDAEEMDDTEDGEEMEDMGYEPIGKGGKEHGGKEHGREEHGGEEHGGEEGYDEFEEDIPVTDSQIMIQLKEAEEEAKELKREIGEIKKKIAEYQCKEVITNDDKAKIQNLQQTLMEKTALLDELIKRIAKLMEMAGKGSLGEETTVLDEDEEEDNFPDDLLPRVVICSSWDDMMPKVVVCMDMKKPNANKRTDSDRDENGLTPEQREELEKERRCMAEERNRLQYQIACMEGEMRVMMRENDMLSKKVAHLKSELENTPPFEFEMSVSATKTPGTGCPKHGNPESGYAVMGPPSSYTATGAVPPGHEMQGKFAVAGAPQQLPPGFPISTYQAMHHNAPMQSNKTAASSQPPGPGQLPCGGMTGIAGKTVPCSKLQPTEPLMTNPNDWSAMMPPYGKKCRKDFNNAQQTTGKGCEFCQMCSQGGGCGACCGGGGGCAGGSGGNYYSNLGGGIAPPSPYAGIQGNMIKPAPVDVSFKVNVQPQGGNCDNNYNNINNVNKQSFDDPNNRSNKIAQQLQEIEVELRRMQRDLCKAKNDKETLKAQQATLNCAKNFLI